MTGKSKSLCWLVLGTDLLEREASLVDTCVQCAGYQVSHPKKECRKAHAPPQMSVTDRAAPHPTDKPAQAGRQWIRVNSVFLL